MAALQRAEVIVFVADLAAGTAARGSERVLLTDLQAANPGAAVVIAANKCDLVEVDEPDGLLRAGESVGVVFVSATEGTGLEALRETLSQTLLTGVTRCGGAMGLHARQRRCLQAGADALDRAAALLVDADELADSAELTAVELRSAVAHLAEITGEVTNEDVLGRIFARFCVGK
jgi:tRNA modification GTPase